MPIIASPRDNVYFLLVHAYVAIWCLRRKGSSGLLLQCEHLGVVLEMYASLGDRGREWYCILHIPFCIEEQLRYNDAGSPEDTQDRIRASACWDAYSTLQNHCHFLHSL